MTTFHHRIMWSIIALTFIMCCLLVYLLLTGNYTSPLCLEKCL
jgi:hypothetical protein